MLSTSYMRSESFPCRAPLTHAVILIAHFRFALNGNPFTTHIFVGKVPDQLPYDFQETGTLVGEVVNFSTEPDSMGNSPAGCQNCRAQQQHRAESSGRVVLTNALITRWKNQIEHEPEDGDSPSVLHSMHPADVVKFLRGNLYWRVTSMGRLLDPETMPSLRISLAVGRADHYADRSMLSRFYDYKAAYEVTQGRPGGADREDGLYPPGLEYSTGA